MISRAINVSDEEQIEAEIHLVTAKCERVLS